MELFLILFFGILSLGFCVLLVCFIHQTDERFADLEKEIYSLIANNVSYSYVRKVNNEFSSRIGALEENVKRNYNDIDNMEDKIENLYDFKYCLDEKTDAILEDLKRTKVNVQRLNVCESCNDFLLRSLSRKVTTLMIRKDKNIDAADN